MIPSKEPLKVVQLRGDVLLVWNTPGSPIQTGAQGGVWGQPAARELQGELRSVGCSGELQRCGMLWRAAGRAAECGMLWEAAGRAAEVWDALESCGGVGCSGELLRCGMLWKAAGRAAGCGMLWKAAGRPAQVKDALESCGVWDALENAFSVTSPAPICIKQPCREQLSNL